MIREMKYYGSFYPVNNLETMLNMLLDVEPKYNSNAIIVPHAAYIYSGIAAGKAFAQINKDVENIFILGPSHYAPINEPVVCSYDGFETPFGILNTNKNIIENGIKKEIWIYNNEAHDKEHSIEVQLPFIDYIFKNKKQKPKIIPILINKPSKKLAKFLENFIPNSLIVVSSDLSHYFDAYTAESIDKNTIQKILNLEEIEDEVACGSAGINTIIKLAKSINWKPKLMEYYHSGFVNKDFSSVVGYASFIFLKGDKK